MPAPQSHPTGAWSAKLAWFAGLWVASVAALGIVGLAIKMALQ